MTQPFDIVGIGAALIDTEIHVADEDLAHLGIEKGLMTLCDETTQRKYLTHLREHIDSANLACGGSAANSMIAAAILGSRGFFTCQVADDQDGDLFLSELKSAGIEYNLAGQKASGTTGKCLVMISPDAERSMNTCLGVSANLGEDNVELAPLENAKYLYLEGYLATSDTGAKAAIKLRKAAQSMDVKVALSLSDPGIVEFFRPQLQEILGNKVDFLFCNEAEALSWTKADSLNSAAEKLKADSTQFAITLGAKGALCWDGCNLIKVAAPKTKAINTNGAGDMFAGCMLAALNNGASMEASAKFACAGAAKVVSQDGPRLNPDEYDELVALLTA